MAVVLAVAECAARFLFPRLSQIQRRIENDRAEVNALARPQAQGASPTLLLAGNSLLLNGLDYPRLRAELSPEARAVRYTVEGTTYLDWYYGLRRLFAEGARPARVALCLNLAQAIDHGIRGDYSARHLFLAQDLPSVAREAGLDHTKASGLFFAHWSAFYADRATIRNYILNRSDPSYVQVMNGLVFLPPHLPPKDEALQQARLRLRALALLCRRYQVEFILIVPPSQTPRDELLAQAGKLENIPVDVPVAIGSLGAEYFRDGFHLNAEGARLFTDALAADLQKRF
jgi:hypothetical protein